MRLTRACTRVLLYVLLHIDSVSAAQESAPCPCRNNPEMVTTHQHAQTDSAQTKGPFNLYLVDDEDGAAQVERALQDLRIEVGVVLPLEAVADVALAVDGLVAREAERAVEGLVPRGDIGEVQRGIGEM